jgi:hypothetical protein
MEKYCYISLFTNSLDVSSAEILGAHILRPSRFGDVSDDDVFVSLKSDLPVNALNDDSESSDSDDELMPVNDMLEAINDVIGDADVIVGYNLPWVLAVLHRNDILHKVSRI